MSLSDDWSHWERQPQSLTGRRVTFVKRHGVLHGHTELSPTPADAWLRRATLHNGKLSGIVKRVKPARFSNLCGAVPRIALYDRLRHLEIRSTQLSAPRPRSETVPGNRTAETKTELHCLEVVGLSVQTITSSVPPHCLQRSTWQARLRHGSRIFNIVSKYVSQRSIVSCREMVRRSLIHDVLSLKR